MYILEYFLQLQGIETHSNTTKLPFMKYVGIKSLPKLIFYILFVSSILFINNNYLAGNFFERKFLMPFTIYFNGKYEE
jgi:hypothetical protein